ncbi:MAG: cell division protein FtsZ [Alphaproteobacteria bacterium]|jgi:cell division protein FtsZ|nr:cell division protein FtsZ [Alphaproteobacteria bacterium]MDP6517315.1 cell division protein FtsZ [Alphaproteobacteria bacterium]
MSINLSVPVTHELKPKITVIGIGGAGGNAVNNMITAHLEGVDFVVANTDAQALSMALTERRIQLGASLTQGLGAGARPDIGRAAAEEVLDSILDHMQGTNMAFVTAGMGGGTGTGAAPVIAKLARDQGVLTVGVVTKPFHFEGAQRMHIAEDGIAELQQCVDTLIVIPNQNLFRVANENTTFADAFKMADDVLYSGVRGVTDLMVMPGLINLDFADVRSVMNEMGKAMMGTGEAEGDKRALDAAEGAINNPLLDDVSLKGARGVLVNITGGPDMTLYEVDEACNHIRDQVDADANIIFGSTFDEELSGRVRVSVVATGIDIDGSMPAAAGRGHDAVMPMPVPAPEAEIPAAPMESESLVEAAVRVFDKTAPAVDAVAPTPAPQPTSANDTAGDGAGAVVRAVSPAAPVAKVGDNGFIPPPPVDPERRAGGGARPPMMAEADLLNASRVQAPDASALASDEPSWFQRMTRSGRARQAQPTTPTPAPTSARKERVLETVDAGPPVAAQAMPAAPGVDEDLLEIPTFLRRQRN